MDPRPIQDLLTELGLFEPTCTRVLLVDDEFEVLAVLEALLDDEWEVHTAESGQEALEILSSTTPIDLVITDQRMPEMTGVELLSSLSNSHPDLYRMVLTAYSDVDPIVAAINEGKVDQFILKPWDPQAIRRLVAEGLAVCERRATMRMVAETLSTRFEEKNSALQDLKGKESRSRAGQRLATMSWMSARVTDELTKLMTGVGESFAGAELNDSTQHARDSIIRIRTLAEDIERLSVANSQQSRAHHAPRKLISDAVRLLMDEDPGDNNPIHVDIDPSIEALLLDGDQIKQALLSMLRNALRATPPDTPIQVHVQRKGQGLIAFEVIDNGAGIDPEVLQYATQPFFSRFDPPSTGLGLSLCQMVAETHGGRLSLLENAPSGLIAQLWIREVQP